MDLSHHWRTPRTAAAAAVVLVGLALGWLGLPADIAFTARRGRWEAVSSGLRVSAAAPALRGGEHVRFELQAGGGAEATLVLQARRRRPRNPVTLVLERDGSALAVVHLEPETRRIAAPFPPGSSSMVLEVEARSGRPAVPPAWFLERFVVERSRGWRGVVPRLGPAMVGCWVLLLLWGRARPQVAVCLALHAAAATLVPLLFHWDPPALLVRSAGSWRTLGLAGAGTLTVTVLAARLIPDPTRGLRRPGVPRQSLALRFVSSAVAAGFAGVGCVLSSPWALSRLYPDLAPSDPAVAARTLTARVFAFAAGWLVLLVGVLASTSRRVEMLSPRIVGTVVVALQLFLYVAGLEALLSPRYPPRYWSSDRDPERAGGLYLGHAELGHVLNPAARRYEIGSDGFRGPAFPIRKPAGETRLVALGNSITFGLGVSEGATFPHQLERRLSAGHAPHRYRVINAGVPAYTSLQALLVLERRVVPLDPDLVVATVGWNDLSWALRTDWYPRISLSLGTPPPRRPAILTLFQELFPPDLRRAEPEPKALVEYRRNLLAMRRVARRQGFTLALTNLPTILSESGNTPSERRKAAVKLNPRIEDLRPFQAVIDRICAENADLVCVSDVFPLSEAGKDPYFFDYCHPTPEGYGVMAARVEERLHPSLSDARPPESDRDSGAAVSGQAAGRHAAVGA